jgi:purine nucleosidase
MVLVKPVILDVDTGIDDALAIAYALRSPELDVIGITTTYGNVDLSATTRNTLQMLELCGRTGIPVYAGAARSLMNPYVKEASIVHGENGFGGVELPLPKKTPQPEHAVDFLIRMAHERPGEITLIPVGPLTNLAMALAQDPTIAKLFAQVVIMGGAVTAPGNVTPAAEANIWSDPEAARVVFNSGANLCLVGLDVTMKTLLTPAMLERMGASSDRACQILAQATRHYMRAYQGFYPGLPGCAMHDPLAVAVAADPSLVGTRRLHVDVECAGVITRGQTLGDLRGAGAGREPNVDVCTGVDAPRFLASLLERLGA